MKNKKGFTLIELIGVIAILSLIISIGTVSFINIKNNALEKDYENLKVYLEAKAAEYASKTGITTVSVEDLIKAGLLIPDNGNDIYNPINNESINCYIITSKYDGNGYTSVFGDDLGKDNNQCNKYTITKDIGICRINNDTNTCDDLTSVWYSNNITLGVKNRNGEILTKEDGYTFEWTSNSGIVSDEERIVTNASKSAESTYKVVVKKELEMHDATAVVGIDRQNPVVVDVKYNLDWTNTDKEILVEVSDLNGSGVNGVYVGESNLCNEKTVFDSNIDGYIYTTKKDIGNYYICVKDNAGNIGTYKNNSSVKIDKIDRDNPIISIKNKELKYPVKSNYNLLDNIMVSDTKSGVAYKKAFINGKEVTTIEDLNAGVYNVVYEVADNASNKVTNEEVTLTIFVPEMSIGFEEKEIEYIVPLTGTYQFELYGAQGANNGGKGAYIKTEVLLNAGDVLKIAVGGQNGYNGGGITKNAYNGGGATTIKRNGNYLIRAAGGGGGESGTPGGDNNGSGGVSAGAGAGANGSNSGGGASSPDYNYSCNCSTCGGGCSDYDDVEKCDKCGGACKAYAIPYCIEWEGKPDKNGIDHCVEYEWCNGFCPPCIDYYDYYDCNCKTVSKCVDWYPTYSCNCKTCTTKGNSGNGGSNYIGTGVTVITKTNGYQSGNGNAKIKYIIK